LTDGVDVKSVPNVMVSNPAVKNIGADTVGFAGGTLGILKLLLTEHALEALSTPYPGLEETTAKLDTTATDALAAKLGYGPAGRRRCGVASRDWRNGDTKSSSPTTRGRSPFEERNTPMARCDGRYTPLNES
jgi:hypothetical protein